MGIIERKQRLKDETRINILDGALSIGKTEGWQSLSMRKIADIIEYTAPTIYEYFASKEAILQELTRVGYIKMGQRLRSVMESQPDQEKLMEEMWLSYWDFAFEEKALYQLMFGVDMACSMSDKKITESEYPTLLFKAAIKSLYKNEDTAESEIASKYYTYWSVVHGLISINMVNKGSAEMVNKNILVESIKAINQSITG
jgi:AcrR family transcriptional regulator